MSADGTSKIFWVALTDVNINTSPKKRLIFYIYLTLYINYNIKIFFTQVLRAYVIKNKKCSKNLHKNARFSKKF